MTFNCPLMLNKVGSEKITLPQAHMLFRFAVYRDSYLDTNPKIAIYRDTVFRGDTHPYKQTSFLRVLSAGKMPNYHAVLKPQTQDGLVFQTFKTNDPSKL